MSEEILDNFDAINKKAFRWANSNKPSSSLSHKHAFADSVTYFVTGMCGGVGPSLRHHLCSWSLAGINGSVGAVSLAGQALTAIYPDGSLPPAGDWTFEEACRFCEPLCFEPAEKYRNQLIQIYEREHCFDDDPADLEVVRGK